MPRSVAAHQHAVIDLLAGVVPTKPYKTLPLLDALGKSLADDLPAPMSLPPFTNSQMDGFAVRSAEIANGGGQLRVAAPAPAGAPATTLTPGTAVPIMTGAMIPDGADAVVPIEKAVPDAFPDLHDITASVWLPPTTPGTFIRDVGSDIAQGECALPAGTLLGPAQLGLLAALGMPRVQVRQPLRVLLVTTGDEVLEPGSILAEGKIYDANGTLLEASLRQAGVDVVRTSISDDNPETLVTILRRYTRVAVGSVDLIVTNGGVSKGAYEVVRLAMSGHPVKFLTVAMQPGGPQGIGTFDGVPFLGFPGNPVSCLISFEMFLRPALCLLQGNPAPRQKQRGRLADPLKSPEGKHQVRRGTLDKDGIVRMEGGAGSHLIHSLARSNSLVHIPDDVTELSAGAEVEVWTL